MNLRDGDVVVIGHGRQTTESGEVITGSAGPIDVIPARKFEIGRSRKNDHPARNIGGGRENLIGGDEGLSQHRRFYAVKVKDSSFLTLAEDDEKSGFGSLPRTTARWIGSPRS